MSELRVVVVDDDYWARAAMATELARHPDIVVVAAIDQDEAVRWPVERWVDVDVAVVDVFDETAPNEVGTDVYSGIAALDHLKTMPVRTLALAPHCQHPLIQLRIHQAQADWLYHRWEINDPERLADVVLYPQPDHRPARPSEEELRLHGARLARVNESVAVYLDSAVYARLAPEVSLEEVGQPRRAMNRFRARIHRTGFVGTEELSTADSAVRIPRWPDVRDYLLTLLGRRDVPATEVDREDEGPPHHG